MPIDASIPLSVNQPKAPDQLGDAMKAFTLKSAMLQSQQVEQQMATQQALKSVMSSPDAFEIEDGIPTPKPETMQRLAQVDPIAAQKLGEASWKMKNERFTAEQKKREAMIKTAGPVAVGLMTEYDQLKKADPEGADAAIQPKIDAALAQLKAQGLQVPPTMKIGEVEQFAQQVPAYMQNKLKATQPETPHEKLTREETAKRDTIAQQRADLADKKFNAMQGQIAAKLAGDEDKKLAPDELNFMARQALRGDTSVFQNIGRGRQGSDNIKALRGEIMKEAKRQGIEPEQLAAINAEFQGLKAGERTLGTRTANIEMAVTEAQNIIPIALQASEKVDRTKFPTINSVLLAAEKGTGGEDVVKLATATNALINVYSRAISPTGTPTVSDKEHAREIIDKAYSKGQYKSAVDVMTQEMNAARKSPGQVRQSFREAVSGTEGGAAGRPDNPASGPEKPKKPLSSFMGN